MTAHARCVGPDNTLVEAAGLMRELDVGALPVCEEDRIAGIVTDRDIAVRAVADGRDPNSTAVSEIMTPGVVYIFADQAVEEAARMMEEHEIRRLPVVNRQKRLVGILSLGDVAVSSNPAFSGLTLREVSQPHEPNGRARRREAMGRAASGGMARGGLDTRPTSARNDGEVEERAPARRRNGAGAGTTTRTRRGEGRQQRQRKTTTRKATTKTRSAKSRGGSPGRRKAAARSGR